jgi:phosphopantothenoylcysteine decarboxylase/phosphopantothenate--cysteine ligase
MGRLADVNHIRAQVEDFFKGQRGRLSGFKALVTAGPTFEPIDPVRYIANRSSGKQGYAVAGALARFGAETVLISGPTNLDTPPDVMRIDVETAKEMWQATEETLPVDIAVCAAAVSDWSVDQVAGEKIKKRDGADQVLKFQENPDILAGLSAPSNYRPHLVIGFSAETAEVIENSKRKLARKQCDWIVANDVSREAGVMGGDDNTVHVISGGEVDSWPRMTKEDVALHMVEKIAVHMEQKSA